MISFSIDKQRDKVNAEWISRPVDSTKNQTTNQPLALVLISMAQSPIFAYRLKRKLLSGPIFGGAYRPILDKVDCDIVLMTQIITDNERKPGIWPWSYKIRIYNVRTGTQLNSISGDNLKAEDFQNDIKAKVDKLVKDIERTF